MLQEGTSEPSPEIEEGQEAGTCGKPGHGGDGLAEPGVHDTTAEAGAGPGAHDACTQPAAPTGADSRTATLDSQEGAAKAAQAGKGGAGAAGVHWDEKVQKVARSAAVDETPP